MRVGQQLNKHKFFCRASSRQRLTAGLVFLGIVALFGFLQLMARYKINPWAGPCGFKQKYGLPCPTCGMTTSAVAFASGKIFESFYIQPAAALLCCVLAVSAFLAFITAVFGVYFNFIRRFFAELKTRYIILALIVIVAVGWAVTLTRALRIDY
ncbi:MAG: hypothetical protein DRP62_03675 [Planctomycetota bacterium]|nr:MAG: hypothetical protein DRP62_03675 [Planctomycetota bacterium]